MTLLHWKEEYSVGIEAVDHEHRELIDLVNRLHDALDGPAAKFTVPAFFGDLLKGISAHFALEEKIMRDQAYDQLGPHKADHERLLDDLCDMMQAYEHSEEVWSIPLISAAAWTPGSPTTSGPTTRDSIGTSPGIRIETNARSGTASRLVLTQINLLERHGISLTPSMPPGRCCR